MKNAFRNAGLGVSALAVGASAIFLIGSAFGQIVGPNVKGGTGGSSGYIKCQAFQGFFTTIPAGFVVATGQLKSSLTTTQQAVATTDCNFGANLPDLRDKTLVSVSGTKALGSTGGAPTAVIAQNQLPNVSGGSLTNLTIVYGGSINGDNNTSGISGIPAMENATTTTTGWPLGSPTVLPSINGGVTQQPISTQNPYVAVTTIIYLGT